LVLATFDDTESLSQTMQFGAKGYLLKNTPLDDIAIAIRAVCKGYTYLGPGLYEKTLVEAPPDLPSHPAPFPPQLAELSPRERQVLRLMAKGENNREIVKALYITEKTVKNTVKNSVSQILNPLGFRDRTQATIFVNSVLNVGDDDLWQ
jgi:DNA-binding NarL/FixJ family response regulator